MKRTRVPLTISLPSELVAEVNHLVKTEAKSKSQLFRDMLRVYRRAGLEQELFELQRYGAKQARAHKILTEADVDALVFGSR